MCGIVGYTGFEAAAPRLLDGLEKLAYRGYDSAGIALHERGGLVTARAVGKLGELIALTRGGSIYRGTCGIGHTRWATHGAPAARNAHPHLSQDGGVAVVHNGIIENYRILKAELEAEGAVFSSETDSEVIPFLIAKYLKQTGEPEEAIRRATARLVGAYALGILFSEYPYRIYAVRYQSPLVAAHCEGCSLIASDVPALLEYTRQVIYPAEGEVVCLTPDAMTVTDADGKVVRHLPHTVEWDSAAARKDGYSSFMEKEIHEVPRAMEQTIRSLTDGEGRCTDLGGGIDPARLRETEELCFLGCGSAYHVGVVAQYCAEKLLGIPVRTEPASEFRYRRVPLAKNCLAVAVSQSGETADTLAAVRESRRRGIYVLGVVNVVGSAIARETDAVLYTRAGPEIAVATTKAYCAQLCAAYLLIAAILRAKGNEEEARRLERAVAALPECAAAVVGRAENIMTLASSLAGARDAFFIGRGADYAACMEGSLKLKEITYSHAEAYAAGELKHGTISLIEEGVPVVAVLTQPHVLAKTLSGAEEVRARGARVIAIAGEGVALPENFAAPDIIPVPVPDPDVSPALSAVAMQLLALGVCRARALDPDQPRNLAKSVTVE